MDECRNRTQKISPSLSQRTAATSVKPYTSARIFPNRRPRARAQWKQLCPTNEDGSTVSPAVPYCRTALTGKQVASAARPGPGSVGQGSAGRSASSVYRRIEWSQVAMASYSGSASPLSAGACESRSPTTSTRGGASWPCSLRSLLPVHGIEVAEAVSLPLPSTRLTRHQSDPCQVILPHTFGQVPIEFLHHHL